jgi:dTDP-4-dehydrorhamnose 3,5-epimerase
MTNRTAQSPDADLLVTACGDGRLPEVKAITCKAHSDARGYLSETFKRSRWRELGIDLDIRQQNQSRSAARHTIRGLHFQIPPFAMAKLVRVVRGAVFDVAVDVRAGSSTFGAWTAALLKEDGLDQLLVPRGFAHGFCTLEPDTVVLYACDNEYAPDHERGVVWNDPAIGIDWPLDGASPTLSDKDAALPALADLPPCFLEGSGP